MYAFIDMDTCALTDPCLWMQHTSAKPLSCRCCKEPCLQHNSMTLCVVQSPTLTLVWLIAINNTVLPVVTFVVDVYGFCKWVSIPEVVLLAVFEGFCIVSSTLGADWFDVLNVFHFYPLPFQWEWRMYMYGIGFISSYLLIFQCVQMAWNRYG